MTQLQPQQQSPQQPPEIEWANVGGGILDNEDITIRNAEFGFRSDYNNGQTCVCVFEYKTSDGEEGEAFISLGKGWTFAGNGKEAVSESGKAKKFHPSTHYAEWLLAAANLAGATLANRGKSTDAGVWIGTQWHVETFERVFPQKDKEPLTSFRLLPTAFLGIEGTSVGAQMPMAAPLAAVPMQPNPGVPMGMPPQPQGGVLPTAAPVAPAMAPVAVAPAAPVAPPMAPAPQAPVAQVPPVAQVAPAAVAQQAYALPGTEGLDAATISGLITAAKQSGGDANVFMQTGYAVPGVQGNPIAEGVLLNPQFLTAALTTP